MFSHGIKEFPEGEQYWMVVWVYLVDLEQNDYFLILDLTEVKDFSVFSKPKPYVSSNYSKEYRTIRVGHPFLPVLEIGSVWHQKKLVFSPSRQAHKESILEIHISDPQIAFSIPLNELDKRAGHLSSYHPFERLYERDKRKLFSSPCHVLGADAFTAIGSKQADLLIIPPSELIRFYHCGSANLLRQVFANGILHDQVYLREATRYDATSQKLYLIMRGHLRDSDAQFVGRLAGDETAHRVVTALGKSIHWNLIKYPTSHLDTGFPFAGPTRLRVAGKWIKIATGSNGWAFLVFSIISCSAELPYKGLHYYRENDNTQTENPTEIREADNRRIKEALLPQDGADISSVDKASAGLAAGELLMLTAAGDKFLQAPPTTRIPKEQQLVGTTDQLPRWYVELPRYSVSGDEDVHGDGFVGPVVPEVEAEPPKREEGVDYSQFREVTEQLRELDIICQYIIHSRLRDGYGYTSAVYTDFAYPYVSAVPATKSWLPIQSPRDKTGTEKRNRRVVVLQLTYGGTVFYLIECEARSSENFSRLLLKHTDLDYRLELLLDDLLLPLAECKGIWTGVWKNPALAVRKADTHAIYHTKTDTPAHVAERISRYIKVML